MSTQKHNGQRTDNQKGQPEPRGKLPTVLITLLVAGVTAAFLLFRGKQPEPAPAPPPAETKTTNETSTASAAKADFQTLKGKWVRHGEEYVVELKNVDGSGKMEAGYFNPRPISVSKAEASQEDGTMKVFIELNDVGYPGCTYTLKYDPPNDRLYGVYFQAAMQERYEVFFDRVK
jgi:hypothetical protein